MEGWIKLYRKITSQPLWLSEPFTRGQAWIDLLLTADRNGDLTVSVAALAERWQWNRQKAHRFIDRLKTENMIEKTAADEERTNRGQKADEKRTTKIHIIKWKEYQAQTPQTDEKRTKSGRTADEMRTNTPNLPFNNNKNIQEGGEERTRMRARPPKSGGSIFDQFIESESDNDKK